MSKLKYILPLVVILVLIFVYFYYLEFFNYANYVFSHFHVDIYKYWFIPGLLVGIWVSLYLFFKKQKNIIVALGFVFCLVTVSGATEALGKSLAQIHQSLLGKNFVIEKVFSTDYGNDYKFFGFLKNYMLENKISGNLILPPDRLPWRHTGDSQIMNSFLYPIATVNYGTIGGNNYLISSETDGAEYHLWPDFKISAAEIIIYDWQSGKAVVYTGKDWDPGFWQDKKPWGIIIKK